MKTIITTLALLWVAIVPLMADDFIPATAETIPWKLLVSFGEDGEREAITLQSPERRFSNLKQTGTRLVATNVPPEVMVALYSDARSLVLKQRERISRTRNPKSKRDYMKSVSLGLTLGDDNARSVDIFVNATPDQLLHSRILEFAKKMKLEIPQQEPAPYPEQRRSAVQER